MSDKVWEQLTKKRKKEQDGLGFSRGRGSTGTFSTLTDLPARDVSHCIQYHLCFWYSQCLAALRFAKYIVSKCIFFCWLGRKWRNWPNHSTFHSSLMILQGWVNQFSPHQKWQLTHTSKTNCLCQHLREIRYCYTLCEMRWSTTHYMERHLLSACLHSPLGTLAVLVATAATLHHQFVQHSGAVLPNIQFPCRIFHPKKPTLTHHFTEGIADTGKQQSK